MQLSVPKTPAAASRMHGNFHTHTHTHRQDRHAVVCVSVCVCDWLLLSISNKCTTPHERNRLEWQENKLSSFDFTTPNYPVSSFVFYFMIFHVIFFGAKVIKLIVCRGKC